MPRELISTSLQTYGDLTVGDFVKVPGHGRRDPATFGELVEIIRLGTSRSTGYFVKVRDDEGRVVTTAIGLCRKAVA